MINLGIVWGNNPAGHRQIKYGPMGVVGYSSYAGDLEGRKSITGYSFLLGGGIVTWCSKRLRTVSICYSEAECVALSHSAREAV